MVEGHALPLMGLVARSDAFRHLIAVMNNHRLMDNMITRIVSFKVDDLTLGDYLSRSQSICIAGRDGFQPFLGIGNHRDAHRTDDVITAGITGHKSQPVAIVGSLHRHRW